MSRVLVTGALGTLGKPLVQELEARGHEVYQCDTHHADADNFIRCDVSDYRQVNRVFVQTEPDYVYHLAAEFGRINGEEYYEQVWRTNAIGTRNIIEACVDHNTRLIFASSSEIYGESDCDFLYEDLTEDKPLFQTNDYAISKWVNELQIRNSRARYGLKATTLRFFNAYGPGEAYHPYRSVVCLFCYRALHGIPYEVYKDYHRTFMHILDFIPTLANVCDAFVDGETYNIGGNDFRSVKELSDLVLENLGRDDSIVTYLDNDQHNIVSKRPDIAKAKLQFNHDPVITLEEGVPSTLNWMIERYGILSVKA